MKFKELKNISKDELDKRLMDIRMELMKLNAQVALGTVPKSTKQIRELKRNLARISTIKMQEFQKELDSITPVKSSTEDNHSSDKGAAKTVVKSASKKAGKISDRTTEAHKRSTKMPKMSSLPVKKNKYKHH